MSMPSTGTPLTVICTTFSFGFVTPCKVPNRTWNGEQRKTPSSPSTQMMSMAPLKDALFSDVK
jgi:hypothetical protein